MFISLPISFMFWAEHFKKLLLVCGFLADSLVYFYPCMQQNVIQIIPSKTHETTDNLCSFLPFGFFKLLQNVNI